MVWLTMGLTAVYFPPTGAMTERSRVPMSCVVSILPQAYFVERIGGENVDVQVMVGPGQSPATYEPTVRQITNVARSRVYFAIGVAIENTIVPRIERSFPTIDVIYTQKGVSLRSTESHHHPDAGSLHTHASHGSSNISKGGKNCGATAAVFDPHVWLSPTAGITIAKNIRDALIRLDSQRSDVYITNCDSLIADLECVDREIRQLLTPLKGSELFVFHPAYGYFTDAYELVQIPIEIAGATPGPKHLATVIEKARERKVKVIFVQPQFSTTTAETVAEAVGARLVPLDPLAKDYLPNLRRMAENIAEALGNPLNE
ncbi:MAG: zinc ABC transporter substrate-binding protein [Candidatus Latescibacterota bacterium]|nr:MAG: zinc ABC transporter substrate-binding protein [Candidatus Latescibacterota bacterium]